MKTKAILPALTLIGLVASASSLSAQSASPTITVDATMAPNGWGSPSFDAWAANGIYAAENGLTSYGAPGPTQFNTTTSPLPFTDNWVTGFPSWMGQAPPPAGYGSELGTRASFVAIINGNGSLINMNSFGVTLSSSDPGNWLGVNWPNNSISPGDWTYGQHDIGIVFNNGNDISGGFTVVNSGDSGQLVNEIISIGAGNAYASYDTIATGDDDPDLSATDQQILNYDFAEAPNGYDFTGTFSYGNTSGSATFDFTSVPDVSWTWVMLVGSFGALAGLRRRFGRC